MVIIHPSVINALYILNEFYEQRFRALGAAEYFQTFKTSHVIKQSYELQRLALFAQVNGLIKHDRVLLCRLPSKPALSLIKNNS